MTVMTTRTLARSLGSGFFAHAAACPDDIALTIGPRHYSYAELDRTARGWAARLHQAVGHRPRRVGVFAHRSETSYLGVLAALAAGAAFVPLNRKFPLHRTRGMLARAELDAVIVDAGSLPQLADVLAGLERVPVVLTEADLTEADPAGAEPLTELPETSPEDLAYLLFTSGSTGTPKGVPVTHGNVRAFLDAAQQRYGLTPQDRLTQTFDQTFDLSVFDLFMAWEHGARVCAMDAMELLAPFTYLTRNGITVWFSVPSVGTVLAKRNALTPGRMPTLRWSLFCGEALPRELAEAWQAAAPDSVVENLYGPTELTIACAAHRWDPETSPSQCVHDNVPIGELFPGLHPLVVDEDLVPVPEGATGELCVAGPQTTPGYWQAPELTAQRYVEHGGRTYYRTGDLVRRQDGALVYLGRNDQQVKVGGYRVELGEIEAVLRRSGCAEAVCLTWPDPGTITAVVSGTDDPTAAADRAAEQLPAYMVPRSVHLIDEMPVNGNGKVDRNALRGWLDDRAKNVTDQLDTDRLDNDRLDTARFTGGTRAHR
ncbi:amino acid adenylation domain-containing protein [Kitasatospora sp. LaBMicrA B282]|uniref:amino acid adenylation domain-containing protein n=1 Tax=Kitasatospora sp. LaBMicrA B282 TaxID=3420949 RepID=UPI003D140E4F